ncbi:P-loop containing nucleoside triphosphate hydrolase protein [Suillus cothurnatus]|nr:P-loop containing nucleoside triphosphate hydrolase protein [Suillus cothurnatus]
MLTFWIPLLFNNGGISIIITLLNILSEKNRDEANGYGFPALDLCAETATDEAFKDIEKLKYRVLAVSPERILQDARFKKLWKSKTFTDNLFNITFDKAHCISEWGKDFRPLYSELGNLQWYLPHHVRFHAVSATMAPHILLDVQSKLCVQSYNLAKVVRSNDRPNIHLMVQEMKYPCNMCHDLTRILSLKEGTPPEKFMIFVNSRDQAEGVCNSLCKDLPSHLRHKIVWFHSGMSMQFQLDMMEKLTNSEIWGICCTDAAGMGLDLRDIRLVIQWGFINSLCVLMKRLGRAAQDHTLTALAVYFVEPLRDNRTKRRRKSQSWMLRENSQHRGDSDALDRGEDDELTNDISMVVDQPNERTISDIADNTSILTTPSALSSSSPSPAKILPVNADSDVIKRAAMYVFINAHLRGFCRRRVTNENFNNPNLIGESCYKVE